MDKQRLLELGGVPAAPGAVEQIANMLTQAAMDHVQAPQGDMGPEHSAALREKIEELANMAMGMAQSKLPR